MEQEGQAAGDDWLRGWAELEWGRGQWGRGYFLTERRFLPSLSDAITCEPSLSFSWECDILFEILWDKPIFGAKISNVW